MIAAMSLHFSTITPDKREAETTRHCAINIKEDIDRLVYQSFFPYRLKGGLYVEEKLSDDSGVCGIVGDRLLVGLRIGA
jgi:hypothetical protein